mgnify:CR=1 FL=1
MKPARTGYHIADQYGTYFLTFTVVGWIDIFTRKECKDIVIESLKFCQKQKGLNIHAFVIMPSHIHLILSAQEHTSGLSNIIRDMKKYLSKTLIRWLLTNKKESRKNWLKMIFEYHAKYNSNNGKHQFWQQNNCPKILLYPRFTNQKLSYIHANPVTAGIVDDERHYLYSSARNYYGEGENILEIKLIDFGCEEGYVPI